MGSGAEKGVETIDNGVEGDPERMPPASPDDDWSAEEWQVFFDERAGIAEFDGGLSRPEAEAQAHACCMKEQMARKQRSRSAS